jgi:purine-cytosine permease-like protein
MPDSHTDRPRRPRRIHSSDLWVLLLFVAILFLFLSGTFENVLDVLYSRLAFVLIVVMLVEFLVLKTRDRSRFYRMQLQMTSNRRREDLRLLRETRDTLAECSECLNDLRGEIERGENGQEDSLAQLEQIREKIEQVHSDICSR